MERPPRAEEASSKARSIQWAPPATSRNNTANAAKEDGQHQQSSRDGLHTGSEKRYKPRGRADIGSAYRRQGEAGTSKSEVRPSPSWWLRWPGHQNGPGQRADGSTPSHRIRKCASQYEVVALRHVRPAETHRYGIQP